MEASEVIRHFESQGLPLPEFFDHAVDEGSIHVAKTGDGKRPTVVFVHGSPGSWDNFIHMLSDEELTSRYTVVAVDRPGFGRTLPKGPEPSLKVQARRIHRAVVGSGAPMPAIWIGHSLGGPVIARLAIDYPESVSGLVLAAPSMDPELEKKKWFNYVAKVPPIKWGLSREWRNSNEEIFPHKEELALLANDLEKLKANTIVVHGDKDSLVPVENADYVKERLKSAKVELRILKGVDHFTPWTHPWELKDAAHSLAAEKNGP